MIRRIFHHQSTRTAAVAVGMFTFGVFLIVRRPTGILTLNGVMQIGLGLLWLSTAKTQRESEVAAERAGRGECEHCGYSLAGNTSRVCPECGSVPRAAAAGAKAKSMGAAVEVRVPDMGRVKSITLVRWVVADRVWVDVGEAIMEIETEKANVACRAAAAGRLEQLAVADRPVLANQLIGRIHRD